MHNFNILVDILDEHDKCLIMSFMCHTIINLISRYTNIKKINI